MPEPEPHARVALYGGGGSPFHHAAIFARAGHEVEFVFPADVLAGALAGFDAFVMPGGGYRAMLGQIEPLGAAGARAVREYVEAGGLYIGCCAGAYDAARAPASFVASCPAQAELCLLDAEVWNGAEDAFGLRSPGIGVLRAETAAPEHPVMAGMPASFEIAHYNGPLFTGAQALARVAGRTERFTAWEEMLGATPERALVDDAAEAGVANIVAGPHGAGRVVLFGSHPEFGFGIAMDDDQPPARMLLNAVAWQLAESGAPERPRVPILAERESEAEPARARELAEALHERTASLRERGDGPRWLDPEHAMALFGRSGRTVWAAALDAIDRLADDAAIGAAHVEPRVLGFRPDGELDGGYHGVIALLEQSVALLDRALATWDFDPGDPGGEPYVHMETSPYHLVAGSYLAAVGRVGAAALLCDAYARVAA